MLLKRKNFKKNCFQCTIMKVKYINTVNIILSENVKQLIIFLFYAQNIGKEKYQSWCFFLKT